MAQSHRLKQAPSMESTSGKSDRSIFKEYAVSRPSNAIDNSSQLSAMKNQNPNGVSFSNSEGVSNVKILSKPKDHTGMNSSESRHGQTTLLTYGNGTNSEKNDFWQLPKQGFNSMEDQWECSWKSAGQVLKRILNEFFSFFFFFFWFFRFNLVPV